MPSKVTRTLARLFVIVSQVATSLTNDVQGYESSSNGVVNGELKLWHKVTIGFSGMLTGELNKIDNPFTDLRLDVTFEHKASAKKYVVPGFYACDGDAANTGSGSGSVWLVHFRPDEIGTWSYNASYVKGSNVAIDDTFAVSGAYFDGSTGVFDITGTDKVVPDLRAKGRLRYVGEHHLQFANGDYFLKVGADSPENLLAYVDFDNTPNNREWRKDWAPHLDDYEDGDPTWMGGKGRGLIGAVNYLASKGMNALSFLTMNIQGDDKNVFPYVSDSQYNRFDCSKTAQWDIVFDHAESKGMVLHFKTQETENDQLLDEGALGNNRTLYYRELIARFGHHLGLNYNIGEENTNSLDQRLDYIEFFQLVDPYKSPIVMHTFPGHQERHYWPLLGVDGFTGVSIQTAANSGFDESLKWVQQSSDAGKKWVVAIDEQTPAGIGVAPDSVDPTHDSIRKFILWANILAGGAGVEYYFGYDNPNSDLTCEDWRSRSNMWDQSRYALEFFANVPYWRMSNADALVSGSGRCLIELPNYVHVVVYLPEGGSVEIDLSAIVPGSSYSVKWFNPRRGGLMDGSITEVATSSAPVPLGLPPSENSEDWAVLLKCIECPLVDIEVSIPSLQVSPVVAPMVPVSTPQTGPVATPQVVPIPQVAPLVNPEVALVVAPQAAPLVNPVSPQAAPLTTPLAQTSLDNPAISDPIIVQNVQSSSRSKLCGVLTMIVTQLLAVAVLYA